MSLISESDFRCSLRTFEDSIPELEHWDTILHRTSTTALLLSDKSYTAAPKTWSFPCSAQTISYLSKARNCCLFSRWISGGTRPVVRRGTTAVHGSRAASSGVARSHCCSCISGGSRPPAILRPAVKSLQVKRAVTWLEFRASRAVNYLCISREPDPLCIHLVAPWVPCQIQST